MMLIGTNPERSGLLIPEVKQQLDQIKLPDTILFDRMTRGDYQPVLAQIRQGQSVTTEIGTRTVTLAGQFPLGASFEKDGTIVTSDQNFLSLLADRQASQVSMGLVKVQPGYSLEQITTAINAQQFSMSSLTLRLPLSKKQKTIWQPISQLALSFPWGQRWDSLWE